MQSDRLLIESINHDILNYNDFNDSIDQSTFRFKSPNNNDIDNTKLTSPQRKSQCFENDFIFG